MGSKLLLWGEQERLLQAAAPAADSAERRPKGHPSFTPGDLTHTQLDQVLQIHERCPQAHTLAPCQGQRSCLAQVYILTMSQHPLQALASIASSRAYGDDISNKLVLGALQHEGRFLQCLHERLNTLFLCSSAQTSTLPYSLPYPNKGHMIMGSNLVLWGGRGTREIPECSLPNTPPKANSALRRPKSHSPYIVQHRPVHR